MTVPNWVQDAVFYQIFPDRFANGDPSINPPNVHAWGSEPTVNNFMGGDLRGIINKFDYLKDLGITAIYLNPIFRSASNHRYHSDDYYQIDPSLGTEKDFRELLDTAHKKDIRVILDGVFNHTGRGFFAFTDILENGENSRYKDWYHIHNFPLDAFGEGKAQNYKAWWDMKPLPKLNTDMPAVREYIFGVAQHWIEFGVDGWRLDVPEEIDDDSFWAEFTQVVKTANPDAYTVGEVWKANPKWVDENHFDGLINYPLREVILNVLINGYTPTQFADALEGLQTVYSRENLHAMYLPLSTHDVPRLLTVVDGDQDKFKLAYLMLFANIGAPAIFYGDEVGVEGGDDPGCRKTFPWDERDWNQDIYQYIRKLITVRKKTVALRRGDLKRVYVNDNQNEYAFARVLGEDKVLCVVNFGEEPRKLLVPVVEVGLNDGAALTDLLTNERYDISQGNLEITLSPWNGVLLGN